MYSPIRKFYTSHPAAELAAKAAGPKTPSGSPPPTGTDIAGSLARAGTHLVECLQDPVIHRASVYVPQAHNSVLHHARRECADGPAITTR